MFGKGVVEEILARVAAAPDVEVCGLLLGTADMVERTVACANVAADPATAFEIDPSALIAALRAERGGGERVVGCYHSHPRGAPTPSAHDGAEAAANGWLWLIAGEARVELFRAVERGPIYGRFVRLAVIPAKAGTHLLLSADGPSAGDGPPLSRG